MSPSVGQYINKAFWDAEVYDRWVDLLSPWTSYTPTWFVTGTGNISPGASTLEGRYKQIGKLVLFQIRMIYNTSTNAPAGSWYFSRPPVAHRAYVLAWATALGYPFVGNVSGTFLFFRRDNGNDLSRSVPAAWGTGGELHIGGMYEAA